MSENFREPLQDRHPEGACQGEDGRLGRGRGHRGRPAGGREEGGGGRDHSGGGGRSDLCDQQGIDAKRMLSMMLILNIFQYQ